MADLQTALFARFTGDAEISEALATRVYWNKVPQGTSLPYARFKTISDPRPQNMAGYQATRAPRIAAEVFAATYDEARSISEKMIEVMAQPATVGGVHFGKAPGQGPVDLGEDTPGGFIHRLRTDFLAEHTIA